MTYVKFVIQEGFRIKRANLFYVASRRFLRMQLRRSDIFVARVLTRVK